MPTEILEPLWSAPAAVRALCTTRRGGVSTGPYADWNLGRNVGDVPERVERNERRLRRAIGGTPIQWLNQAHGVEVHRVLRPGAPVTADAAWTEQAGLALAVAVADCVPVVFCDASASIAGVAHCGWRGTVDGIVEATVAALPVAASALHAWLGPAICGRCYEVGSEVRERAGGGAAFGPTGTGTWLFDLPQYVAGRLQALGVREVARSGLCTRCDARFYSYRRDGVTGRVAAVVWLERHASGSGDRALPEIVGAT